MNRGIVAGILPLIMACLMPVSAMAAHAVACAGTFVGTWYGTAATVGTIAVEADGSYEFDGHPGGHWKAGGNQIVFDGNLTAWGGGKATLNGGNLAFSWRTPSGFHQWFTFARKCSSGSSTHSSDSGNDGGIAAAGKDEDSAYSVPTGGRRMGGSMQGDALALNGKVTRFATIPGQIEGLFEGVGGIATDGTNLYVVAGPKGLWGAPGYVFKVSLSTGAVTKLATVSAPGDITTDGKDVYIQSTGNIIDKISISTGYVSTLSSNSRYGSGPMTTDGKNLYVMNGAMPSDKIDVLSTSDGRASGSSYNTGAINPDYITTDGRELLILGHNFSNQIALFRMAFGTHMVANSDLITSKVPDGPMTSDGTNLYIVSGSGITKVSTSTGAAALIVRWPGTSSADSFSGITTDGRSLYVADGKTNTIFRIVGSLAGENSNETANADKGAMNDVAPAEWFKKGVAAGKSKNWSDALEDFTHAIELNPRYASAYNNRGVAYKNLGNRRQAMADFAKAIDLYTNAIERKPRNAFAYNDRGVAYCRSGDFREGISDFTKAIELNPRYALAYNNRSFADYRSGNHEQAMADCSQAIKLRPGKAWGCREARGK